MHEGNSEEQTERESPLKIYRRYGTSYTSSIGRFPWGLIFHIFLVIISTAQVITLCHTSLAQARAETRYFYFWFFNGESSDYLVEDSYSRFIRIFDIDTLNETIKTGITVVPLLISRTFMIQTMILFLTLTLFTMRVQASLWI